MAFQLFQLIFQYTILPPSTAQFILRHAVKKKSQRHADTLVLSMMKPGCQKELSYCSFRAQK